MKFIYFTRDGKRHEKIIDKNDHEKILAFIEWLETDKNIIKWY